MIGGKVRVLRERTVKSQTMKKLSHCQDLGFYSE